MTAIALPHRLPTRYIFFGLAGLGLLMASIDATIVSIAIPSFITSFDTSLSWVGWTLTAYQLVQVIVMPVAGKLSDSLGRKRVFLFCVGCFTVGSLLCGLAPSIGLLIMFRVLEAVGAGGLMPSAVGIISDQFGEKRNQAIGLFTTIIPLGGILGPNIGGWVLEHWSWREIFFVNLPFGIILLVGTYVLLKEKHEKRPVQHIDVPGLALLAGGLVAIMYAMTRAGTETGMWRSPLFWGLLALGIAFLVAFVRYESRAREPIVDMALLFHGPFLPANLYNFIFGACAFGFFSFVPYFMFVQYQMGPEQIGRVLTPRALAMIGMAIVASMFLLRRTYRLPMVAGAILIATCLLLLSFGWTYVAVGPIALDGFWVTALVLVLSGIGMGMAAPAANNASIDLLPAKAAQISGLRGMFRWTGGIMGISSVALALSFFEDKAAGMRTIFLVLAFILPVTVPLAFMIPDLAQSRKTAKAAPIVGVSASAPVGPPSRKG